MKRDLVQKLVVAVEPFQDRKKSHVSRSHAETRGF